MCFRVGLVGEVRGVIFGVEKRRAEVRKRGKEEWKEAVYIGRRRVRRRRKLLIKLGDFTSEDRLHFARPTFH